MFSPPTLRPVRWTRSPVPSCLLKSKHIDVKGSHSYGCSWGRVCMKGGPVSLSPCWLGGGQWEWQENELASNRPHGGMGGCRQATQGQAL